MRTCIAVVDASRARLFMFERVAEPAGPREELAELSDLVNPARRRRPSELFSDTRPGSSRAGRLSYAFDDHRDASLDRMDANFARSVGEEIDRIVHQRLVTRLIVCASPRMLGALREVVRPRRDLVLEELARDLVKLTPSQLRGQLASLGLLPPEPPRPSLSV